MVRSVMESLEESEMRENSRRTESSSNRELSRRSNGGIEVVLLWRETTGELTVCVSDQRDGIYFELNPPSDLALDAYHHPYSYAGRSHTYYEDERIAA
jgi:hypothetical protein